MTILQYPLDPVTFLAKHAPTALQAEQELLGTLLLRNEALVRCAFLQAEHFHNAAHGQIFAAIKTLIERGEIANPVTLKAYFERDDALAHVGGAAYLARLAAAATSIINVEDYARVVHRLAMRRQLSLVGQSIVEQAINVDIDAEPEQIVVEAQARLLDIDRQRIDKKPTLDLGQVLDASLKQAETAYRNEGRLYGATTGITALDSRIGGLQKQDMVIVAGRPSMGKTALALSIAKASAQDRDRPAGVVIFSLEMSAEQLGHRLLSDVTGIDSSKIMRGLIDGFDFDRLVAARGALMRLPVDICDRGGVTTDDIRSEIKRIMLRHPVSIVIVDYLQMVRPTKTYRGNRVAEITEISGGLKEIAKELDVAMVALSQLSRAVELRDDKRPHLSDLRESGALEQDADVVLFPYREFYYLERSEPPAGSPEYAEWQARKIAAEYRCELICAKNRRGPVGTDHVFCNLAINRFRATEAEVRG